MELPLRPTLRMIAQAAGVSLAATSMALRDHPSISKTTRERIRSAARKLGYHPDPKLSALMQHLRAHGSHEYRETLAYVCSQPYSKWRHASQHDYFLGAAERASELGYKVEIFNAADPGMTPLRMSGFLNARGIKGLLIGPFNEMDARLELDWSRFAAVTFGYSLTRPNLHRVTTDYHRAMLFILERLTREGCKRIGLNIRISDDVRSSNLWRSAYLFFADQQPRKNRIPMNAIADGYGDLSRWVNRYKPDAIVSAGCDFPKNYSAVYAKPPPAGIRYVNMNIFHADGRSRGIDQDSFNLGRAACEQLIAMLQRDEMGIPECPQATVIEGRWVEDYRAWYASLRKRTRPAAAPKSP